MSGWGWLPFKKAVPEAVTKVRAFAVGRDDSPCVGIGTTLPDVHGFRRSHYQAQTARSVAVARRQQGPTVLAASDPGLSVAALLTGDIAEAREWVAETLGPLAPKALPGMVRKYAGDQATIGKGELLLTA